MTADTNGETPLHLAAWNGHAAVVQQLLVAAPEAAMAVNTDGETPLHLAARGGHAAVVQLLLAAAPGAATAGNGYGRTPLHHAAWAGRSKVVQLLLEAGPAAATPADAEGKVPLHCAAERGHAAVTQQLLAAAPGTATATDATGATPLRLVVERGHLEAGRCLIAAEQHATPPLVVLHWAYAHLLDRRPCVLSLFGEVAARLPLGPQDWQLVPSPCPGLAVALPAVLRRSEAEAGRLVAHLPAAERARLRLLALCLSCAIQRRLPADISRKILALALIP